jgi:hypothetical protein
VRDGVKVMTISLAEQQKLNDQPRYAPALRLKRVRQAEITFPAPKFNNWFARGSLWGKIVWRIKGLPKFTLS